LPLSEAFPKLAAALGREVTYGDIQFLWLSTLSDDELESLDSALNDANPGRRESIGAPQRAGTWPDYELDKWTKWLDDPANRLLPCPSYLIGR
jgi:hypothetical protein